MNDHLEILRKASAGLVYPSESDHPFEVIRVQKIEELINGRAVVEQSPDAFFAELLNGDDGPRYRQLQKTMQRLLRNLKVLRVGQRQVDVYVLGQTKTGDVLGLHTVSVET
ncbi:MAG TPA: nuclease A inhibitor family protein [Tepidisphaeraceae bacterium]|jgi:hypothetical protein